MGSTSSSLNFPVGRTFLRSAMMAFSIGVYFPLIFAIQRWATFPDFVIVALLLFTLPCLLGIAGLWANRKAFMD